MKGSISERFWSKVDKNAPNGCWEWTASLNSSGYGQFCIAHGENPARAHRLAWELSNGEVTAGLWVLHKCDNRKCVNPGHLFLGTAKQNTQDCIKKGRFKPGLLPGERHVFASLSDEHVLTIRFFKGKYPAWIIARKVGANEETVNNVLRGRTWKAVV